MDKVLQDLIYKLERQVGVQIEQGCSDAKDREYQEMLRMGKQLPANVYEDKENPGEFVQRYGADMSLEERQYLATLHATAQLQEIGKQLEIVNQWNAANNKRLLQIKFWVKLPWDMFMIAIAIASLLVILRVVL